MGSGPPESAGQHFQRLFSAGSLTGLSDGQLLERYLASRDEFAFEVLVERHAAMVLSVCRRSLDDPADRDDAFQATFLVLARRACVVRNQKALASWLFGVARRACLMANRAAARRRKHERRAAEVRGACRTSVVEPAESGGIVYEEIERLPSSYRLPVLLCLMEGRSRAEAAAALRWSESKVRGRLARARRLLRSRLIRRGVAPATAVAALVRESAVAGTVPRALIEGAARVATGRTSAGAVALTEGVIKMMILKKLTLSATVVCGSVLVAWTTAMVLSAKEEHAPAVAVTQVAPDRTAPPGFIPLGDPGKSVLHGRVIDPEGKPVAGARVFAKSQVNKIEAEALTDADGRFRLGPFEAVYRSRIEVSFDSNRFAHLVMPRDNFVVYPGLDGELGDVQLDRGRVFTGQVLDVDGRPRADATIEPHAYRNVLGHTVNDVGPEASVKTDAEGRFRTPPLPPGRLTLTVSVPERQLAVASRTIRPGGEEDLGPIHLERDVPVKGVVRDEEGKPIVGVRVVGGGGGRVATTDVEGRFTLSGYGPDPSFQMNLRKDGYVPLIGRVTVTGAGVRYATADNANPGAGPRPAPLTSELTATLRRVGWIEGRAIDADTAAPVPLEKVVKGAFVRMPGGEVVVRRGARSEFEQLEPGQFRVPFEVPDEIPLTFSAAGYHDAEVVTPKLTELKTVGGIVARLKKKVEGSIPPIARQTIAGTVTRDGRPIQYGWVGIWRVAQARNPINAPVLRGRLVVGPPISFAVPVRDGFYDVDLPFQGESWYVVVEEPGHPLTQVGPIAVGLNEMKKLDIVCREGGRIRGRVTGVPPGWEGNAWVVAFSKAAVREEARVAPDGTFAMQALPPGEYGLKAGHDAYDDAEVYPGDVRLVARDHPEVFKEAADPWKRAKVVTVRSGEETSGVEVEFPAP
jgi:RNA polymerase sigma factor (sigma-70 family)